MKRETQTIWKTEEGSELLVLKSANNFYIPLSNVGPDVLRELGKAIEDALSDELIQAMNGAKKGGAK